MTQIQNTPDEASEVKAPLELRKMPEKIFLFLIDLALPALVAAIAIYYLSGLVKIPYASQDVCRCFGHHQPSTRGPVDRAAQDHL